MIKLAAIDIGSNAVRLMLSRVWEDGEERNYIKESLIRVPLRLGEDVFKHHRITTEKIESLLLIMKAFKQLIHAYQAADYIACATSAMREAENGKLITKRIKKETGLEVELIEGRREAAIIYSSHIGYSWRYNPSLLYIDVGGGSTELTILARNRIISSASFKIGAVRMLQKSQSKREWSRMKDWLKMNVVPTKPVAVVGTGGSINNLFRLSRKKEGKTLSAKTLRELQEYLASYSVEDRVKVLGLRPDRADVIVQAADIYLKVMTWAKVRRMYVPILGLADGLIHVLYEKTQSKHIDL
jgi:exopolyphosphatase/guanosine-5'-triphosphate,3'-diphosphate pyrophosphatase